MTLWLGAYQGKLLNLARFGGYKLSDSKNVMAFVFHVALQDT